MKKKRCFRGNLKVSVDEVIRVKVVVVLTKGIEQRFCHLVFIIKEILSQILNIYLEIPLANPCRKDIRVL